MTKNKKWCLLANCFDPTLLRNYVAFKLAEEMGLMVPDCRIVQLTLDGVNKGCYLLTEATENTADIDTDLGEFFIETEASRVESESTYFISDGLRFVADDPEYEDLENSEFQYNNETYKSYIQNTLDNLTNILNQNDYSKVEENFDVDSLAKFYLLNEYYKVVDVGYHSTNFVYRNGKLTAGPVWDFDLSSGNANYNFYVGAGYFGYIGDSSTTLYAKRSFFIKLLNFTEFKDLVCAYYEQYKDTFENYYKDDGIIDQTITQYEKVINNNFSQESTGASWHVSTLYSGLMRIPDTTYNQNVNYYKNWLKNRNSWMSSYLRHCLDNNHTYTSSVTSEPTCTDKGVKTYTCVCGANYNESITETGHNYSDSTIGATCITDGYTAHTCNRCGSSYTDNSTSALGHSGNLVSHTTKTITNPRINTYKCKRCGTKYQTTDKTLTSKTIYKGKTYNEGVKGTWKSSNKKIATVTSTGKITAKKAGTCTITAKVNGTTYKCKITVKNKTLTVSKSSVTLKKGKSTTVTAKSSPSATVKWSSSNKKVATVSNGRITAKKKGSCTISVKANGITKKIKVTIK